MTTASELQHVQAYSLLLTKTAEERMARLLLEMTAHLPAGNEIDLPMRRQDIAEYLDPTIETVSHTITLLESNATIAVPNSRHIVLRNRAALSRLSAQRKDPKMPKSVLDHAQTQSLTPNFVLPYSSSVNFPGEHRRGIF
jgi:hypothetical protein